MSTTDIESAVVRFESVNERPVTFALLPRYEQRDSLDLVLPGGHDERVLVTWDALQVSDGGVLRVAIKTEDDAWEQAIRVERPPHIGRHSTAHYT
jgi:hypothetical protein